MTIPIVGMLSGCGETRLITAIQKKDADQVQKLLKGGANPNTRALSREPALNIAIEVGDKLSFRSLLEYGADPSFCNQYGTSAMHRAAEQSDPEWLRELLDHGGNLNQINVGNKHYRNSTPIYYAIYKSQSATTQLLIERGAALNYRDQYGFTPLHRAVEAAQFADALKMLEAGADPTIPAINGKTLFQLDVLTRDGALIAPDEEKLNELAMLREYFREHAGDGGTGRYSRGSEPAHEHEPERSPD